MKKTDKIVEKLWPELPYPCSYSAALDTMTKQELTGLRTLLRIKNVSQLNKNALIEKLIELIPQHMGETVKYWDEQRISHFKTVLSKGGFSTNNFIDMKQADYFHFRGILFQATVQGRKGLVIPQELLLSLQGSGLHLDAERVKAITELVALVRGMLYYYGVLSIETLQQLLPKYSEDAPKLEDAVAVLIDASGYYPDMEYADDVGFYNSDVRNPAAIVELQGRKYADLNYHPYTKEELTKAADENFFERGPQYNEFIRFILEHYEMNRSDADFMITQCVLEAKNGGNIQSVLNVLQEFIEIPEQQYANQLFNKLAAVLNHSTQWALKGYSPDGVSPKQNNAAASDVSAISDGKKKVGRNDPCPCGSGKKFKKCCMA